MKKEKCGYHQKVVRFFLYLGLGGIILLLVGCGLRTVKIGFIGGLSGYYADLGIAGRNGLRLALEEANKNKEMAGVVFQLIAEDDRQDPEEARRTYKRLVASHVVAIVGPMTSSMAMAIVPEANGGTIPLISPTVSTPDLSGKDDMFLRVVAPSTQEAQALASLAVEEGYHRALVVFDASNEAFSGTIVRNFIRTYEEGCKEKNESARVESLRYVPREEKSHQSIVEAARQHRPEVILLITTSIDTALLAQHLRRAGLAVPLLGTGWGMSQALIENGGAAVEGMRFCVPFNPLATNPEWLTFKERYLETYGVSPDFAASQGYLAGRILVEALKRGSARHIKENILQIKEFQGPQGKISFDPYGDPVTELHILEVRNGQFVTSKR
ncbi:ABC transporter substrate-binding protein [Treponema sp. J25]|uniref:ABC transporter substrate-binding protein n=1 Tax=Treponema sp. J25 TaxID=2094121 RepID=UPI001404BA3B|nr:ABC transporter substrate-binding protein [Treponema sp. J25]